MKLGIIGRGAVAQALGTSLGGKHEIRFGVRSPGNDREGTLPDVAEWADVIILATPWAAEESVAQAIRAGVRGKPVIDATNPLTFQDGRLDLVTDLTGAAAETLQTRLPEAHVAKCFNQIGAEIIANPGLLADRPVMFAAADDQTAKAAGLALAADAGFEALDAGPLSNARHLESLAVLWIWSAANGPLGRTFGFAVAHGKS